MLGNEYQALAMRTCNKDLNDTERLYHGVFGLCSEAGEVSGMLQKVYQGHDIDREHMIKELGDVCWMVAEICDAYGVSLDDVMETNIEKLRNRFPDGFEAEKSLHRKAGDI